jgi:hypothetical protein
MQEFKRPSQAIMYASVLDKSILILVNHLQNNFL